MPSRSHARRLAPLSADTPPPAPRPRVPLPGYKFQFVTLAGFHALNFSMFSLAREYATRGMAAYADLQVRAGPGSGASGAPRHARGRAVAACGQLQVWASNGFPGGRRRRRGVG